MWPFIAASVHPARVDTIAGDHGPGTGGWAGYGFTCKSKVIAVTGRRPLVGVVRAPLSDYDGCYDRGCGPVEYTAHADADDKPLHFRPV